MTGMRYNSLLWMCTLKPNWIELNQGGPIELFLVNQCATTGVIMCGMCYPLFGIVNVKDPSPLIPWRSGSGFPLSLSDWSFTICLKSCIVRRYIKHFLPCFLSVKSERKWHSGSNPWKNIFQLSDITCIGHVTSVTTLASLHCLSGKFSRTTLCPTQTGNSHVLRKR